MFMNEYEHEHERKKEKSVYIDLNAHVENSPLFHDIRMTSLLSKNIFSDIGYPPPPQLPDVGHR
jgi:hypothetical protein